MIDRYLRELIAGGASKETITKMLSNIGYKESEVKSLLEKYSKEVRTPEINIDQKTAAKIASEYLYKHTNEANMATKSTGIPSDLRDAIGHLSRSQAIFNSANVVIPRIPLGNVNNLKTNDRLFSQIAKQVNSITGYNLPSSAIAYNARAMEQFTRELQKMRGMTPTFSEGGDIAKARRLLRDSITGRHAGNLSNVDWPKFYASASYKEKDAVLMRTGLSKDLFEKMLRTYSNATQPSSKMISSYLKYTPQMNVSKLPEDEMKRLYRVFNANHTERALPAVSDLIKKYGEQKIKDIGYNLRNAQILRQRSTINEAFRNAEKQSSGYKFIGLQTRNPVFDKLGKSFGVVPSSAAAILKYIERNKTLSSAANKYIKNIRSTRIQGGEDVNASLFKMFSSRATNPLIPNKQLTDEQIKNSLKNIKAPSSGYLTKLSRIGKTSGISTPNLSFLSTRESHPWGIMDTLKSRKNDIVDALMGIGGTGALAGILGHVSSLALSGFVPPFASGGDLTPYKLTQILSPNQLEHSVNVAEITKNLQENAGIPGDTLYNAAILHDISKDIDEYGHGNLAAKIVKNSNIFGKSDTNVISALIKNHSGMSRPNLKGLSKVEKQNVKTQLPLLRIADTLSRTGLNPNELPLYFGKSGKLKYSDLSDLGLTKKKTTRLISSIKDFNKIRGFAFGGSTFTDILKSVGSTSSLEGAQNRINENALDITSNKFSGNVRQMSIGEMFERYAPMMSESSLRYKLGKSGASQVQLDKLFKNYSKVVSSRYNAPFFANGGNIRVSPHEILTSSWNPDLNKLNNAGKDGVVDPDEVKGINPDSIKKNLKGMFPGSRSQSKLDNILINPSSMGVGGVLNGAATDFVEQNFSSGGNVPKFALGGKEEVGKFINKMTVDDLMGDVSKWINQIKGQLNLKNIDPNKVFTKIANLKEASNIASGMQFVKPDELIRKTVAQISNQQLREMSYQHIKPSGGTAYQPRLISNFDAVDSAVAKLVKSIKVVNDSFEELDKDFADEIAKRGNFANQYYNIEQQRINSAIATNKKYEDAFIKRMQGSYGDRVTRAGEPGPFANLKLESFSRGNYESALKASETKSLFRDFTQAFARESQFTREEKVTRFTGSGQLQISGISDELSKILLKTKPANLGEMYGKVPTELTSELDKFVKSNKLVSGDLESQLQNLMKERFGKVIGNIAAENMVRVTPSRIAGGEDTSKQFVEFQVNIDAINSKFGELGKSTDFVEGTLRDLEKEIQGITGDKSFRMRADTSYQTAETKFGERQRVGEKLKEFSWKSASLSMSSMGVYFSMLGLFNTLQGAITALSSSLSDLGKTFQNIGYVNAFRNGMKDAAGIMQDFGVNQKDLVAGWKNIMYVQSAVGLMFSSLAAKMFTNKEFVNNLTSALGKFFSELSKTDTLVVLEQLAVNFANSLPSIIVVLNIMGKALEFIAKNQTVATLAIAAFLGSLIIQPIAAFASASLMLVGSFVQITAYSGAASAGVKTFTGALSAGMRSTILYTAALVALLEVGSRLYDTFTGSNTSFARPSTYLGFKNGGEVPGQEDGSVDNHVVRVDEGEYVINKKSAKKLGKNRLDQLNKYAMGGSIGSLPDVTPAGFDATKVQQAIKNASIDNLYYIRHQNELLNQSSDYNRTTRDVLSDSAGGSRPLYVFDLSNKGIGVGTTGTASQFPFTVGTPAPYNLVADNPLKGDLKTDLKGDARSDLKDIKSDLKDIKSDLKSDIKSDLKNVKSDIKDSKSDTKDLKDNSKDTKSDTKDMKSDLKSRISDSVKSIGENLKSVGDSVKGSVKVSDVLSKYSESIAKGQAGTEATPKTSLGKIAEKVGASAKSLWAGTYNPAGWGLKETFPSDMGDVMALGGTALQSGPYSSQMVETGLSQALGGIITAGGLGGLSWLSSKALSKTGTSAAAQATRGLGTIGALTETGATNVMNAGLSLPGLASMSVLGAGYTWNKYKTGTKVSDLSTLQTGTDVFTGGLPQASVSRGISSIDKLFGSGTSQKLVSLQNSNAGKGIDALANILTNVGSFGARGALTSSQTQLSNYLKSSSGQQVTNTINKVPVLGNMVTAGLNQAATTTTLSDTALGTGTMLAGINDLLSQFKSQNLLSTGLATSNPLLTAIGGAGTVASIKTDDINSALKGVGNVASDLIGSFTGIGTAASAASTSTDKFNDNVEKLASGTAGYATIIEQGKGTTQVAIDKYGNILSSGGEATGKHIDNFGNVIDNGSGEIDKNFAVVSKTISSVGDAISKATDNVTTSLQDASTKWSFVSTGALKNQPSFVTGVSKETIKQNAAIGTITNENNATGEWSFEGKSSDSVSKNTEALDKNTDALSKNVDESSKYQSTETSGKIQYYTDENGNKYGGNNTGNDYVFNEQSKTTTTTSKIDVPSEYTGSTAIGDWTGFNVGTGDATASLNDVGSKIESGNQQSAASLSEVGSKVDNTNSQVTSGISNVQSKIDTTNTAIPEAISNSTTTLSQGNSDNTQAITDQTTVLNNILSVLQVISQYVQTISSTSGTTTSSSTSTSSSSTDLSSINQFLSELTTNSW